MVGVNRNAARDGEAPARPATPDLDEASLLPAGTAAPRPVADGAARPAPAGTQELDSRDISPRDAAADSQPPEHLAYLLHRVTRRMRADGERHGGGSPALRASESRLLDLLPVGGARLTELSGQLGITKQGLGQVAAQLAALGYVELGPDPVDRRARLLRRTPSGDAYRATVRAALAAVEEEWGAAVGAQRYATFRDVLRELAAIEPATPG